MTVSALTRFISFDSSVSHDSNGLCNSFIKWRVELISEIHQLIGCGLAVCCDIVYGLLLTPFQFGLYSKHSYNQNDMSQEYPRKGIVQITEELLREIADSVPTQEQIDKYGVRAMLPVFQLFVEQEIMNTVRDVKTPLAGLKVTQETFDEIGEFLKELLPALPYDEEFNKAHALIIQHKELKQLTLRELERIS